LSGRREGHKKESLSPKNGPEAPPVKPGRAEARKWKKTEIKTNFGWRRKPPKRGVTDRRNRLKEIGFAPKRTGAGEKTGAVDPLRGLWGLTAVCPETDAHFEKNHRRKKKCLKFNKERGNLQ